jgi:hypothetical protein
MSPVPGVRKKELPMPLTVFEAEAEARWRWGNLFTQGVARYVAGSRKPFEVGVKRFGQVSIRGRGASWEGAFSDANARTNSDRRSGEPVAQAVTRPTRKIPIR